MTGGQGEDRHQVLVTAKLYRLVCERFNTPWLREQIEQQSIDSVWEQIEKVALIAAINQQMLNLTQKLLTAMTEYPKSKQVDTELLDGLLHGYQHLEQKWQLTMQQVYKVSNNLTFSVYAVTVKKLTEMCGKISQKCK